jgi:hypothetical protein
VKLTVMPSVSFELHYGRLLLFQPPTASLVSLTCTQRGKLIEIKLW